MQKRILQIYFCLFLLALISKPLINYQFNCIDFTIEMNESLKDIESSENSEENIDSDDENEFILPKMNQSFLKDIDLRSLKKIKSIVDFDLKVYKRPPKIS